MKLITEANIPNPVVLSEAVDSSGNKQMYIEGVFIECDVVNKNNRIYPLEVMKLAAEKYITEKVKKNIAWGELNHPKDLEINPDRISHRIVKLKQKGSNYIGKAILADTPCGNICKGLIKSGGQLAVSTRGGGDTYSRRDGVDVVEEGFILVTGGDIVLDPSAPSAFVNGIMEGREWIFNNGSFTEIQKYKKAVNQIIRENKYIKENRALKYAKLLENYIESLSTKNN